MNSFVISLKSAHDRRSHILKEFENQKLPFSFFDAIEPSELKKYSAILSGKSRKILTDNEISCLLSHVLLWKKVVAENIPYIAIFEDDVFLGEDAGKILNEKDRIPSDLSIIKLQHFYNKVVLGSKSYKIKNTDRNIYELKGPNLGAAGYILSNEAAQKCLEYLGNSIAIPVDHLIFDKWIQESRLKVYQINPAICIQELSLGCAQEAKLESSLCSELEKRMRKHKKRGWLKVKNEFRRIGRQIKFALTQKTVNFR